jgi:hypothetical protein
MQPKSGYLILVITLTTGVQALERGLAFTCDGVEFPHTQEMCGSAGCWWKWMPSYGKDLSVCSSTS